MPCGLVAVAGLGFVLGFVLALATAVLGLVGGAGSVFAVVDFLVVLFHVCFLQILNLRFLADSRLP